MTISKFFQAVNAAQLKKVLADFKLIQDPLSIPLRKSHNLLPELNETTLTKLQQKIPTLSISESLIKKMPKTDLHVHAEAGYLMDVEIACTLAKKYNISIPKELFGTTTTWKYRGREDFMQFIDDFKIISALIQTPEDLEEVCYSFYKNCHDNNVIFSLPGISWVQCKEHMSFIEFNEAYNRALTRGMKEFGDVSVLRLRYYQERHESRELITEIWELLQNHPNRLITTIGLAGAEGGNPLANFSDFYEDVRKFREAAGNQWYFLTAHMEAFSNSETINQAMAWLDWIAHGRKLADNPDNIAQMKNDNICFEICPNSDEACYPNEIPDLTQHKQMLALLEAGVVTLNSDDPAFFGNIKDVYQRMLDLNILSYSQLLDCTLNGLSPASPKALQDMEQFKPEYYADYEKIMEVGILKVQFFKYYWHLLPLIADLEPELAKKLFDIDLKMSFKALKELKTAVAGHPEIAEQLELIMITKKLISKLSQIIIKDTESLTEEFTKAHPNENVAQAMC